jgi:hypothetical protein
MGYSQTCVDGVYGCFFTLSFAMLCGDGPTARQQLSQAGSLRTLIGLGDRQAADMATARADAVDAAPGSMAHALRADVAPMQDTDGEIRLRKRKYEVELAKVDAELDKINEDHRAFMDEQKARREEAQVRIADAQARRAVAESAKEAAEIALQESRAARVLAEAEAKRRAQLVEARQEQELRADVEAGIISAEAAERLQPRRVEVRLEKYVERCLEGPLAAFKAVLDAKRRTTAAIASELGKRARLELANRTRFAAKPSGDVNGGRGVTWYEEDCPELFGLTEAIVKAWTALPAGQTTLRLL